MILDEEERINFVGLLPKALALSCHVVRHVGYFWQSVNLKRDHLNFDSRKLLQIS